MQVTRLFCACAALGLSGCATTASQTTAVPLTAIPDEHAEFHSLRMTRKNDGVLVSGWARSKRLAVSGSVHVEALAGGMVLAATDVSWRPSRVSGPRLRTAITSSSSFYFSKKLPPAALSASEIRISHGHRGHTNISRGEDNK